MTITVAINVEFVTAGDAIFTIEIPDEWQAKLDAPPHYTFRVEKTEANDRWPAAHFVKLLCGPDNTSDYAYLGKLDTYTGQVKTTAKSLYPETAAPVRLVNRILARVWSGDHDAYERFGFRCHHEGKCGRCGRTLTTPESIERGLGPECAKKL